MSERKGAQTGQSKRNALPRKCKRGSHSFVSDTPPPANTGACAAGTPSHNMSFNGTKASSSNATPNTNVPSVESGPSSNDIPVTNNDTHATDDGDDGPAYLGSSLADILDYLPPRVNDSFYLAPTCKDNILFEIKKMKSMKAPDHDSIGTKIIHLCPEIFAENLSKLFNNSISQGIYPNAMKIAKVIALFKSGIKANPNNYRPISLLSHFDKIFEKILCKSLIAFLE